MDNSGVSELKRELLEIYQGLISVTSCLVKGEVTRELEAVLDGQKSVRVGKLWDHLDEMHLSLREKGIRLRAIADRVSRIVQKLE